MVLSAKHSLAVSGGLACIVHLSIFYMREYLSSSYTLIFLAGYIGSFLFMLLLTAMNNYQVATGGPHSQSKFFQVVFSLLVALSAVVHVHRLAITSCIVFSMATLYFLNRISVKTYEENKRKALGHNNSQKDNKLFDSQTQYSSGDKSKKK